MKSFQRRWEAMEWTFIGVIILLILIIAYLNWLLAILSVIVVVAVYLINYNTIHNRRRLAREQFGAMMKNVTQAANFALQNLPTAIVLVNKQGTLVWNNSVFADWVPVDWNKLQKMSALIPGFRIDKIWGKSGFLKEQYGDRYFQVVYKFIDPRDTRPDADPNDELTEHAVMALYFKDITEIEKERIKAQEEQPVWGMIQIDNIEELTKGLSDREYTNLWAEINNIVVDEIDKHEGFIRNFQDDMYTFAISRGALQDMENNGFSVLERIRKLPSPRQVPATISIGIGENAGSVKDVSERARAALDIALGRGGDQVCIMDGESTRFFGGNTAGVEKNTRVRARVVSQAIHELMNDSDKILVMGHQREDYDALGGAIGVVSIARTLGKEVRLVLSKETNAIDKMVHVLVEDEFWKTHIITPAEAKLWADANTLAIQLRAKMVFEANRTEGIAISVAPAGMKDMMALAAQSADMLISNEDIEAAFVLYSLNDGGIGVSARSKGKVNVQVVMEALGGGGHRTVAGAQLQGMTIEEAKAAILDKALEALHSAEKEEE